MAAALFVIAAIDTEKMASSVAVITGLFADLTASMVLLEKLTGGTSSVSEGGIFDKLLGVFSGRNDGSKKMIAMAGAILILGAALKVIADIDSDKLEGAFMAITGLMVNMTAFMKVMASDGSKSVKGATQMLVFAAALKVLASVCKDLSELKPEEIAEGLIGIGVLMAEVAAFSKLNNSKGNSISSGTGIVLLASGLKILASALNDLKDLNIEQLATGLTGIGVLLAEIGAFSKLTSDSKHMTSTGTALIEIAAAMKIMASAFNDLKNMSWEEMARGLVTMGAALGEITLAVNLMPKNMLSVGSGLLIVSAAILVLSKALGSMGTMSWEEIAKGLTAMGLALAELAIGLNVMTGTLAGSAAMAVAAAALALLTPILLALGSMSWESIAKGLITLAGAFTVIGVAGYALAPITPILLTLTGAFALLGVGVLAIGAGVAALGAGVAALGAGLVSLAAGVAAFSTLGTSALSPIGVVITSLANGITAAIEAIGEMLKALILTLVDVITECAPALAEGALTLIYEVLTTLAEYAPQITTAFL
ncbi:MAG: hypothetical protein LUD77_08830 [Clostridiales bacterium]|nr:hypothetical protein [Clostridiales bacterium]